MDDYSRENENEVYGDDQYPQQSPDAALPKNENWRITVPVAAEEKYFRRHEPNGTWSMPTDILLRVLEYVEMDFPTLTAIPTVCREWYFYSNFMPHWAALFNEETISSRGQYLVARVKRVQRESKEEDNDDDPPKPMTRRLAWTVNRNDSLHGEYRYRLDHDPGLLCGMCYNCSESIETECGLFMARGVTCAMILLVSCCLCHPLSVVMDTNAKAAAIPSYYGDGDCGPRYCAACAGALFCPCCAICQNRRLFGAYSPIWEVERQKPLEELVVEVEEMI